MAARAGNWLFHCHLAFTRLRHLPIADMLAGKQSTDDETYETVFLEQREMGGPHLVRSGPWDRSYGGAAPRARRLTLLVERASDDRPGAPSYKYVLNEGGRRSPSPARSGRRSSSLEMLPVAT